MKTPRMLVLFALGALAFLAARPASADSVTNGSFGTGDLTGWTVFTTSNGTTGAGLPTVVMFDVTGGGATNAAEFNVGEVNYDTTEQGGGLMQSFSLASAGTLSLTLNFASLDDADGMINSDAGTFSVLIDGSTVASDALGGFTSSGQILRGSFDQSVSLGAGSHTFEILITRSYISDGSQTPTEYITGASLGPLSATPEPAGLLLLGTGLLGLGLAVRRGSI